MKVNKNFRKTATAIISSSLILSGCHENASMDSGNTYSVYTVKTSDQTISTSYSATIRGRQDIDIYPQISGKIVEVRVSEGQPVKKGQILFVIDQIPYKAALSSAKAVTSTAQASLATAKLNYESNKELHKANVISDFDLSTSGNELMMATARLEEAEAGEVNAANNLSYTEVRSPSDGVIGMLPYKTGALVGPAIPQAMTTVSDNSSMYVYFSMTEKQLLDLTIRYGSKQAVISRMPELVLQLSNGEMYEYAGKLESISGVIDRSTGSAGLRAVFPNPDGWLYSGSTGNVLITENRQACITIPQSATFEIQDKTFVYKVVDGKAAATQVTVRRLGSGKDYIVENGLTEGDIIVESGVGFINEGTEIHSADNTMSQLTNKEENQE